MSIAQLLAAACDIETEDDLTDVLNRASELAKDSDPGLAFAFSLLADEDSDISGLAAIPVADLMARFPHGSDAAELCNAVSTALQQFDRD